MRKILILLIVIGLVGVFIGNAYALDPAVDTGKTQKKDKEQTQNQKRFQEQRDSEGMRESDTKTEGIDRQTQDAVKVVEQAMNQTGADVTLPLEAIFLDRIAQLEGNTYPFSRCQIATAPKLGRDFGLSAEIRPGVFDTILADYLSKAAQSSSHIRKIADEKAVRAYRNCLAMYGAVIAQAYLYLAGDLEAMKISTAKDKNGTITIRGIGYEDFISLADSALQRAIQGIENSTIRRMYARATNDNGFCQFDRNIENIKCGSSLIILSTKPQLYIHGIQWYGEKFAGYQGTYKVSMSWSYQDAIERLKSTSTYEKFAREVSRYAEEMESQGRAREATLVRKKAFEMAKAGKQAVSPSRLIPGP